MDQKYLPNIWIILLSLTDILALQQSPGNTAVVVGHGKLMLCQGEDGDIFSIIWKLGEDIISQDQKIVPRFRDQFAVIADPQHRIYDLWVIATEQGLAGKYSCAEINGHTAYAMHIVLDSEPLCRLNVIIANSKLDLIEGEVLVVKCETNYKSVKSWNPEMNVEVKVSGVALESKTEVIIEGQQSKSTFTIKALRSHQELQFVITISFPGPPDGVFPPDKDTVTYSRRAPDYKYSMETPPMDVKFQVEDVKLENVKGEYFPDKVENMTLENVEGEYFPGDKINCYANGRPAPQVKWIDLDKNEIVVTGGELRIGADMTGKYSFLCEATNEIRGIIYITNKTINIFVRGSSQVKLKSTNENGKHINHLSPGKIVNLNCTYNFEPLFLHFYNGTDKNIFARDFATRKNSIGNEFERLVKSYNNGIEWLSIALEIPYCYNDEVIKCTVVDQRTNKFEDTRKFPIGVMNRPVILHKDKQLVCGQELQVRSGELLEFKCQVSGIAPEANFTWSRCQPTGVTECVKDFTKCLWIQSSVASCAFHTSTYISCSTNNTIGHKSCPIHVRVKGSEAVNLVATDENGKPTKYLTPGEKVNLDCTYNTDPLYLVYYNGTDKSIFVWDFLYDSGETGQGFGKSIKSSSSGEGWVSIVFEVPYCYKDEVIKCEVLDKSNHRYVDKKTFAIGTFQKPGSINGILCGGNITIGKQQEEFPLTCEIFGVVPEGTIKWSDGCNEHHIDSTNDAKKCFFNQTSLAICNMYQCMGQSVTCSVDNGIGEGNCTIMIQGKTSGRGESNLILIIGLTLTLLLTLNYV